MPLLFGSRWTDNSGVMFSRKLLLHSPPLPPAQPCNPSSNPEARRVIGMKNKILNDLINKATTKEFAKIFMI